VSKKQKKQQSQPVRRRRRFEKRKEDKIYFEKAEVIEALPGTTFKVRYPLEKENSDSEEEQYLYIHCNLKTKLKIKKVMIVKGDKVTVEVDPQDMYLDETTLKGIIIERN
jgi:translation initiation factor IF-1